MSDVISRGEAALPGATHMIRRACTSLVFIAALALAILCGPEAGAQVIGKDNRKQVPENLQHLRLSIGELYVSTTNLRCTATCVRDRMIATAAHCVYRQSNLERLDETYPAIFRLPKSADSKQSWLRTRAHPPSGMETGETGMSGNYASERDVVLSFPEDWAFVYLAEPICKGRTLEIESQKRPFRGQRVREIHLIARHHDRTEEGFLYQRCRLRPKTRRYLGHYRSLFARAKNTVIHDCDIGKGSSGAPLLRITEQGATIVGVNAGSFRVTWTWRTRSKKRTRTRSRVRRSGVGVKLPRFGPNREQINYDDYIKPVQQELARLGCYAGKADGDWGPKSRTALIRLSKIWPVDPADGPTRQLLSELKAIDSMSDCTKAAS